MTAGDMIIIAVLLVAVFFAARAIIKSKKSGGCSGDCSSCGKCGGCSGCSGCCSAQKPSSKK